MKTLKSFISVIVLCKAKVRLFILAGGIGMEKFDHDRFLTPMLRDEYARDTVIVVNTGMSQSSMYDWDKNYEGPYTRQSWTPVENADLIQQSGLLFDQAVASVGSTLGNTKPDYVGLIWFQGWKDAKD